MFAFFLTPLGRIVGTALLIAAAVAGGKLWLASHDAAIREGMVTIVERDALQAKLDKERSLRATAEAASARAQERAAATEIQRQAAEARIDELQAQATKEGLDGWSKDELDWLMRH